VEAQAAKHISIRYRTAQGAPIIQDAYLHQDFGYLTDIEATDKVRGLMNILPRWTSPLRHSFKKHTISSLEFPKRR
jgi:hypothetical protein